MTHLGKPILEFEGRYFITDEGIVTSIEREVEEIFRGKLRKRKYPQRVINCRSTYQGYRKVSLWMNNKMFTRFVHRLVAVTYLPNDEKKPYVNHKDGDRANNTLSNLEWCTQSENCRHSIDVLRRWPRLNFEKREAILR